MLLFQNIFAPRKTKKREFEGNLPISVFPSIELSDFWLFPEISNTD
jgi:hypothetical protein